MSNVLDIAGLAGIAFIAATFAAFATGPGQEILIEIPLIGQTRVAEFEALMLALFVAVVFISKSIFSMILSFKTAIFIAGIESELSHRLAEDFFGIGKGGSTSASSLSDFQTLAIQSTTGIKTYLNARVLFFSEGSLLVALTVVFLIVNPIATVALSCLMGVILYFLNSAINSRLKSSGRQQIEGSKMTLQAAKDLSAIRREVVSIGAAAHWLARISRGRERMSKSTAMILTLNGLPRYVIETSLILGIFVFMGGVVVFSDISSQAVTIGVFLAGGLRIMASVIPFQGAVTSMRSGAATGQYAFEALEAISKLPPPTEAEEFAWPGPEAELRFERVSFKYQGEPRDVIREISLVIEPRTLVAIVGPSGAGKSTLLDLAMGFVQPREGKVLYGGVPSNKLLVSCPGAFGIVPQNPTLVTGSIIRNIALDANEPDVARVKESLRRAGLNHLTSNENWQELEVNPDLGHLSGGEIQRLGLARALYQRPKILFLDEPTSSLDARTELEITKVIENLRAEMTVVFIAHRLSTVKSADKIIYMDDGALVAQGNFEELRDKTEGFAEAIRILGMVQPEK